MAPTTHTAGFDKDGYIEIPPVAGGLSETLRAAGYEFVDAMADLVDNSIDAGATEIYVNIGLDSYLEPQVFIADNGCGMSRAEIAQALTYGSEDSADSERLGKFGIGLKTASTAFCRRILILTRDELGSCWRGVLDLDDIKNTALWRCRVTELDNAQERALLDRFADRKSGTLLWWDQVDHLLDKDASHNESSRKRKINTYSRKFAKHASRTFHRFLDHHDDRARNVNIFINDEKLRPNNPICEGESATQILNSTTYNVRDEKGDVIGSYNFSIALLPNKDEFSNEEAFKRADITQNNQGIYVYRENRIIAHQGWMGVRDKHPSGNYLRAALDMDHRLDEVLKIDYKKDSVTAREGFCEPFTSVIARAFNSAQSKADKATAKKSEEKFFKKTVAPKKKTPAHKSDVRTAPRRVVHDDVWITPVTGIDGSASLWSTSKARINDKTELKCNHEHPFYKLVASGKVAAPEAVEMMMWTLGNAQTNLVEGTDAAKMMHLISDEISSNLRSIAESYNDSEEN